MSRAAEGCDYLRNVAPRAPIAALNLLERTAQTGKDDKASAGTSIPADASQGVSPIWIWTLSRQFLRPFPSRLPAEQCPSFQAGLARDWV